MMKPKRKIPRFYLAFALVTLVILADFAWPVNIIEETVTEVQKERQNYYNAGGNYHYSYKVATGTHSFQVSEDFASADLVGQQLEYAVSPIFEEVNWYKLEDSKSKSFHSLRLASGLILPLLVLLSMFVEIRFGKKIGTLGFVLRTLLVGDLIFLLT